MDNKCLELLTIKEVRVLFKVKESKIRKAILNKEIPYVKLGGLIRFKKNDLVRFLDGNTVSINNSKPASKQSGNLI